MLKLLIKLALAALLANAAWRLGSAYLTFYRFKDAVTEAAQFGGDKTDTELQQRVVDLASQYDIPLTEDGLLVRRNDRNHTFIDGSYTQPVDLLPGYRYPWPFSWQIDVFTLRTPPPSRPNR
jgi:hypothetical protein